MNKERTIIGITGNIATGKSVVRRMLANAGALGLDADVIAHRTIYPQGSAYPDVVTAFGESILSETGEISRPKLGRIVFQDPEQLARLEAIVHPAVQQAIQERIDQAQTPIIALEAVKLLEAGLDEICDEIWVSHTPSAVQLERLLQTRGLTFEEAETRMAAQPPQTQKLDRADVIIKTAGPFENTWSQIRAAINDTIQMWGQPSSDAAGWARPSVIQVPFDALLQFWDGNSSQAGESLYEALGLGMVQPLTQSANLAALLLWQSWNFTAALTHVLPARTLTAEPGAILDTFLAAGRQQEIELLMLPARWVEPFNFDPAEFGFERFEPDVLTYPAWQEAARSLAAQQEGRAGFYARFLSKPIEAHRV